MSNFRTALLSTAAAGLMVVAVAPASAGEVEKSVTVSGRVNVVMNVVDNGENTATNVGTGNTSPSRFAIKGNAKSESMTIGATIELGAYANSTTRANAATDTTPLRQASVTVSNDMGALTIGYDYSASDGVPYRDLSGTGLAGGWQGSNNAGSELFRINGNTATGDSSTITASSVTGDFGGGGRDNVIKYTSPNMAGFTVKGSYGASTLGDIAAFYDGDFDGTKVQVSAGYQSGGASAGLKDSFSSSVAVALPGGLNAGAGYSKENQEASGTNDGSSWGAKVGYTMGANSIAAYYKNGEDYLSNGDEGTVYGLLAAHSLSDYGTTIYAGISETEYEVSGNTTNYDDITTGWVGIAVFF